MEDLGAKRELFAAHRERRDAGVHPGVEHVVDFDHRARRRHEAPGPRRRHAFLQSGAADAAGRDRVAAWRRRRPSPKRSSRRRWRWGKTPVHASSTPGFIVNRCARPFYAEGLRLLAERAADPATLDAVIREAGGFRMGPVRADRPDRPRREPRGDEEHLGRVFPRSALRAVGAAAGARRGGLLRPQVRTRVLRLRAGGGEARAADRGAQPAPAQVTVHGDLGVAAPLADAPGQRRRDGRAGARRFAVPGRRDPRCRRRRRRVARAHRWPHRDRAA